jgi:RNA polymerase sigma factor (sigma-70 family)
MRPQVRVVTDEARAQARRRNIFAADIEGICGQYQHRVHVWCLRNARNVEDAEDRTQDTFLLLCRKINTYRGESAFSTWLYRLATNTALMRLRRKILPQAPLDEILETHVGAINPRQELRTSARALAASVALVDWERMFDQMPGGPVGNSPGRRNREHQPPAGALGGGFRAPGYESQRGHFAAHQSARERNFVVVSPGPEDSGNQ